VQEQIQETNKKKPTILSKKERQRHGWQKHAKRCLKGMQLLPISKQKVITIIHIRAKVEMTKKN